MMYIENIGLMIGFHGCSKDRVLDAVTGKSGLKKSENKYDWLGSGIYFWDRDAMRALEFAKERKERKDPAVVGAVITPGNCLDLRCREGQEVIRTAYEVYSDLFGPPEAENHLYKDGVAMKRDLDCLIINTACDIFATTGKNFDTVIGTFIEGRPVFPGAGVHDRTHTQISVRNPKCILGYFLPGKGILPKQDCS